MKSWLRFFGLSFFSDKIAKEARNRGVLNCVLGFVLALVFLFCGVLASNTVPFYSHYKNASGFKDFVNVFAGESGLKIENGLASSANVINTFEIEADAEKYAKNGYNLVIDTRPSAALDKFEAYCTAKAGEVDDIIYEEYLALTDEAKGNYEFRIKYTPNELILTEKLVEDCESYLNTIENEDVTKQFNALKENKPSVTAEEYNKSVYALWVHTYYPEMTKYERAGAVPLLRSYYYRTYLYSGEAQKSLFVFSDVLFGYFETDGGIAVSFYGTFGKMPDGALTADGADKFVTEAFQTSVSMSANVYLLNVFRFIPFIAAIPVILALAAKLVLSFINDEKYKKFTTCLKIEFSYMAWTGIFTAVILFILGFFISSTVLNVLPLILLAAVMFVRTAVLLIGEYILMKKAPAPAVEETAEESQTSTETEAESE